MRCERLNRISCFPPTGHNSDRVEPLLAGKPRVFPQLLRRTFRLPPPPLHIPLHTHLVSHFKMYVIIAVKDRTQLHSPPMNMSVSVYPSVSRNFPPYLLFSLSLLPPFPVGVPCSFTFIDTVFHLSWFTFSFSFIFLTSFLNHALPFLQAYKGSSC